MKKKNMEIQYNTKKINQILIVVMGLAFLFQCINVFITLKYPNLRLLDFYIYNTNDAMIENIVSWLLPVVIGMTVGSCFNYFYTIRIPLFTRCNQSQFVCRRAWKAFIIGFMTVFLFYVFSYIFLVLIFMVIDNKISFGVIMNEFIIEPKLYFGYPYLYVLMYILFSSGFGGLYALIAYATSLFVRNKIVVALAPFIWMVASILISEAIPFGWYLDPCNAGILTSGTYIYGDGIFIFIIMPLAILLQNGIVAFIIKKKGKADLC